MRVFVLLIAFCLAPANAQPGNDYHPASEALLPFFRAAIARFQHDRVATDTITKRAVDAQQQVNEVNQYARSLMDTLQAEISQYEAMMAEVANAAQKAAQADAEAKRVSVAEHKYDWRTTSHDPMPMTPREELAQADARNAQKRAGELAERLGVMRQNLNSQFASRIKPGEDEAFRTVAEYVQQVTDNARTNDVRSKVRVRTANAGAIAHFQTLGQRLRSEPGTTASQQTSDGEEPLPIGIYYVWTERRSATTSDKNRLVTIVEEKVTIDVEEN